MAKIKKYILILVLILIILVVISGYLLLNNKNNLQQDLPDEQPWIPTEDISKTVQVVDARNEFYTIKRCVEKFYIYYADIFNDIEDEADNETLEITEYEKIKNNKNEKLYKILDEEYLKYNGLTIENINTKLKKVGDITITIKNMYWIPKNESICAYFVYGIQKDASNNEVTNFSMMVKIDKRNRTYKLLLGDYVEAHYKDLKIGDYIEIKEEEIKNDIYNQYSFKEITDEEYTRDLFLQYRRILKEGKEETYNLLDEKYKEKNFESLEEYLNYINANYSKIINAKLEAYNKKNKSEYAQYIFKDTNENYYIFKETAPFQYTVMLDNYTIPTEDFIENYNSSKDEEKVVLNIKKFFMGIDDKNYGYSYNVLSEAFRNNNYQTKNDFINYAEQNFFKKNKIEYINYTEENGVYIYKIKISDKTGKSAETKQFNIIIRLKEGTDFEMSFSQI